MEMSDSRRIPAPPEQTWHALNDPAVLQVCIPGCERIVKASDTEYHLVMAARVGPVNIRFNGALLLSDVNAPHSYTLTFQGRGGVASLAKASADVTLMPQAGGATTLSYRATAHMDGRLARLSSFLVNGTAKRIADRFFNALAAQFPADRGQPGEPDRGP